MLGAKHGMRIAGALVLIFAASLPARAELNPANTTIARLPNGLTVLVMEEHAMPIVSVQMTYKTGARDETMGKTGLAHFMEHMAFRASQHFADTKMAGAMYDAGGEWHAYTWLDQTVYYETAPKRDLGLLLNVEADRMHELLIPPNEVDAERGAVLAEMHGYQNDPSSVLHDDAMYTVFQAHPYRENTIGWEEDVDSITHADIARFYRKHYVPANAVLSIVGDVDTKAVLKAVAAKFGCIPAGVRTPLPHTQEPQQLGVRRFTLLGPVGEKYFEVAYRVPSSRNKDYAAFLVAQEILSSSSGVNFHQNDWGTPAKPGSLLYGIGDSIATWFPPSEQNYVFTIEGRAAKDADQGRIEDAIEAAVMRLQTHDLGPRMAAARAAVLRQLDFDLDTTEEAAHQIGFFEGIDALDVLQHLPELVKAVTAADVARVAKTYLEPSQRNIGWYMPGTPAPAIPSGPLAPHESAPRIVTPVNVSEKISAPVMTKLGNGTPVILERSPMSDTAEVKIVVAGNAVDIDGNTAVDDPAWGYTSLSYEILPRELEATLKAARAALGAAKPAEAAEPSEDPLTRLSQSFQSLLGLKPVSAKAMPALIVVTGLIDPDTVLKQLNAVFGDMPKAEAPPPQAMAGTLPKASDIELPKAEAQYEIGYLVKAPSPRERESYAWRIALYTLTHDYGGRLGDDAITKKGLVYDIDNDYASDGRNGWITLTIGVDPAKVAPMTAELKAHLTDIVAHPPTEAEIAAAKSHLLGRAQSAAQSNMELTDKLARQYLFRGTLTDPAQLAKELDGITRKDVVEALKPLASGTVVVVEHR